MPSLDQLLIVWLRNSNAVANCLKSNFFYSKTTIWINYTANYFQLSAEFTNYTFQFMSRKYQCMYIWKNALFHHVYKQGLIFYSSNDINKFADFYLRHTWLLPLPQIIVLYVRNLNLSFHQILYNNKCINNEGSNLKYAAFDDF